MKANAAILIMCLTVSLATIAAVATDPDARMGVVYAPNDVIVDATTGDLPQAVRLRHSWREAISTEYTATDVGCANDLSASGLNQFFASAIGPIKGSDEPRPTDLGDGRVLWILQDTFLDLRGDIGAFSGMDYVNNSALIQDGRCFTLLQRGTTSKAESFELGDATPDFNRYFWAGGSTVSNGRLSVVWIEFHRDPPVNHGSFDGTLFHPTRTWIADYDIANMHRLDFRPAPNNGTTPIYGYGITDDGPWTYLFGNSDMQNLALEGGYGSGAHSATRMYLARVPRGHLADAPDYWQGVGWTPNAADAVPISERYYTENLMLPVRLDGHWYSATKVDGFLGNQISIDEADNPWGPYTTIQTLPATPAGDPTGMITYHAAIMPWLNPNGDLVVTLSQIPPDMSQSSSVQRYHPSFFAIAVAH